MNTLRQSVWKFSVFTVWCLELKKKPVAPLSDPLEVKPPKKSPESKAQKRVGSYKTFTLKKTNNSITIELYSTDKAFYFTSEVTLHEGVGRWFNRGAFPAFGRADHRVGQNSQRKRLPSSVNKVQQR